MSGSKKLQVSDDELLAVASGDEVAFGLLYDRVSTCLFGLVVRIVAEQMLAEKTLLVIFSYIWRHAHTFDPAQNTAQRWVFDIAYQCAATSLSILLFLWTWNQFLLAIVLVDDPAKRTMAGALGAFQGRYGTDIPLLCAGSLLILTPTLIIFLIFQRQFVAALMQGSLKGEGPRGIPAPAFVAGAELLGASAPAADADRAFRGRAIDDLAALGDVYLIGGDEAAGCAAGGFHQLAPLVAADGARRVRRADRGRRRPLREQLEDGGLELLIRRGDAARAASI